MVDPTIATRCNCSSLRRASRKISQLYDQLLAPAGLRGTQYSIFAEINRRSGQPMTITELAQAMVMDRSTLGHNLRPLERDGLIVIAVDMGDRRSRIVKMTPSGQRLFEKATPLWQAAQSQFERAFGMKNSSELRVLLHSLAGIRFVTDTAAVR